MKMVKRRNFFTGLMLLGVLAAGFSLISCEAVTGFFSNSWGENLKRNPKNLVSDVNSSNANEMVKTFMGDPKASKALLEAIVGKARNAQGAEKVTLQKAGLTAAINASELETTIIKSAGNFLSNSDSDEDQIGKIAETLQDLPDITGIANDLESLFGTPSSGSTYSGFGKDSDAGNKLVVGAVICLLADFQENDDNDFEEYINDFADKLDGDNESDIVRDLNTRQRTAYYLLKTADNANAEGPLGDLLKEFHF
jgi:hypothetical protein